MPFIWFLLSSDMRASAEGPATTPLGFFFFFSTVIFDFCLVIVHGENLKVEHIGALTRSWPVYARRLDRLSGPKWEEHPWTRRGILWLPGWYLWIIKGINQTMGLNISFVIHIPYGQKKIWHRNVKTAIPLYPLWNCNTRDAVFMSEDKVHAFPLACNR